MRVTFGRNEGDPAPTAVRFDVAWCVATPEFRAQGKKVCWWFDLAFPTEALAAARLQELQFAISENKGNLAIYEVHHDKNRIVSERILARTGGERPPFRSEVQIPPAKLKSAFDEMLRPKSRKSGTRRSVGSRIGLTLGIAAGFSAMIGLAVFFAGTSMREAAERMSAKQTMEAERFRSEPGRILVPRGNQMCDKLLFDNQAGGMKVEGSVPCVPERAPKAEPTTFTSTWPGKK
jgi:hypothetical protein